MVDDLFDIVEVGEGEAPAQILRVHVQPGAGRTAVVGRHGDALKVKIGAPPTQGRANAACVQLVADTLGIGIAQVELTSGASSRSKRLRVTGVDIDELRRHLTLALEQGNSQRRRGVPHRAR